MLAGFEKWDSPDLLGYVKTTRKAAAQSPLLTDTGDPLLAHWRFGLGKVTAFTSDAKSRWASLWIARWPGYSRFWSQILRETARPPQGRFMDLATSMQGDDAKITVDLLSDAGTRANNAAVTAEVFHIAADALGAPMKPTQQLTLTQTAPGEYGGHFQPSDPGVYLIRARSGAEMVSAARAQPQQRSQPRHRERKRSSAKPRSSPAASFWPKTPRYRIWKRRKPCSTSSCGRISCYSRYCCS